MFPRTTAPPGSCWTERITTASDSPQPVKAGLLARRVGLRSLRSNLTPFSLGRACEHSDKSAETPQGYHGIRGDLIMAKSEHIAPREGGFQVLVYTVTKLAGTTDREFEAYTRLL